MIVDRRETFVFRIELLVAEMVGCLSCWRLVARHS